MGDRKRDNANVPGELMLDGGHRISYTSIGDARQPLLLFIVGSSGLGYLYSRLAVELSGTFRCVFYDKRGFLPRGTNDQIAAKQKNPLISVERQSDDAAALIKHLSPGQAAYIFGTSTGGTAALDLTIRYPELVQLAILHEPITFSVMRDIQLKEEMLSLYWRMGEMADSVRSFAIFTDYMFKPPHERSAGATVPRQPPKSAVESYNARQGQQEAIAMAQYVVDEKTTHALSSKLVVICGKESADLPVGEPGKALARLLGDDNCRKLPGDHMSFATKRHAAAFSKQLRSIFLERGIGSSTNQRRQARM